MSIDVAQAMAKQTAEVFEGRCYGPKVAKAPSPGRLPEIVATVSENWAKFDWRPAAVTGAMAQRCLLCRKVEDCRCRLLVHHVHLLLANAGRASADLLRDDRSRELN